MSAGLYGSWFKHRLVYKPPPVSLKTLNFADSEQLWIIAETVLTEGNVEDNHSKWIESNGSFSRVRSDPATFYSTAPCFINCVNRYLVSLNRFILNIIRYIIITNYYYLHHQKGLIRKTKFLKLFFPKFQRILLWKTIVSMVVQYTGSLHDMNLWKQKNEQYVCSIYDTIKKKICAEYQSTNQYLYNTVSL